MPSNRFGKDRQPWYTETKYTDWEIFLLLFLLLLLFCNVSIKESDQMRHTLVKKCWNNHIFFYFWCTWFEQNQIYCLNRTLYSMRKNIRSCRCRNAGIRSTIYTQMIRSKLNVSIWTINDCLRKRLSRLLHRYTNIIIYKYIEMTLMGHFHVHASFISHRIQSADRCMTHTHTHEQKRNKKNFTLFNLK